MKILSPADPNAPKYWTYETSGVLRPVVEAYLKGRILSPAQIALMRAYLRQWIISPVWAPEPAIERLREQVGRIESTAHIHQWLEEALHVGIDPL